MGLARATYSCEAGMGSAPIAHSAAITDHPVRKFNPGRQLPKRQKNDDRDALPVVKEQALPGFFLFFKAHKCSFG
ncbi:MAG: alanine:cation symporter family protein [Spirochaetaceae bacterium]|jgi:hypothetical protein|nr:alanine:cation symporter family protein [Spirochaetaceae bacterium]